jgi:predicted ATP-dependent endonuclease of OLD family
VVRLRMSSGGAFWPIEFASAGTVETLAVLSAVIGASNRVVLLDEPAQNMHPEFQHRLLQLLRRHAEEDGCQYVVITHSPFLITRESLGTTWHVRRLTGKTRVVRVMDALAKLDAKLPQKMVQQFDSTDILSLLFSRGTVLVEGLSDKWVVQEMDRKAASAGKGPHLMENEWSVVAMNSSGNTATFVGAAETLGLDYAVLLDGDARNIAKAILEGKGIVGGDEDSLRENGFFILKGDIDELFGIKAPNKPLKALERTLTMEFDETPAELREFFSYLEERMRTQSDSS